MALLHPAAPPRVWLVLEHDATVATATPGALALAASAMSDDELRRLDAALVELGRRLDVRANPLGEDLDDEAPDAQLKRLLPTALPKLTAAAALLAPAWRGTAGGLVVRASGSCPRGARCVDAFARGGDEDARRARFLAWPISGAALLELADERKAKLTAERLRAQAAARDSHIALVLDGAASGDGNAALAAHARHVAHRLQQAGADARLATLLDGAPAPRPPAWLPLAPGRILVVPRLGGVADLVSFTREIEAVAPDAEWLAHPRAFD